MSIWLDLTGTEFSVRTIDVDGVATRALRAGIGPDVVFLHGTSGHLEAFSRNIGAHVEAGFRCHAIDMLGHGYTAKPDLDYEIPRYVEHLLAFLDAARIPSAHIVGESLGGWVAARLAVEAPQRVRTLQLVAAGGTKANPAVMERIRTSTRRAVEADDPELTRQRLELLLHDPADVTDELVEVRHRIYHQPEFKAALDHLLCLQDMEVRQRNLLRPDDLARITQPTLVVWGRENPFGDVPESEAMHAAIPGSRLVLYPECGHWPQYEHATEYNELSIGFLREHA